MSVGIMDADMAEYILVPFNLEAMKLSAYYKKKGEIVILSPTFSPDRHTKFIYRKDYDDGDYPINLLAENNVEYGGLAFSNNRYNPLPLEIEKTIPDTSIYDRMEDRIMHTGASDRKKIFHNMITAEHCRLSLDGKTVWSDYESQFKSLQTCRNIIFHDYDLAAIDNGYETVRIILSRARRDGWATRVGMKFPVQARDGQTLLNWSSIRSNSTFYSLKYDGVIDDEPFLEWVGKCNEKAIYTQMEYHVTASRYVTNDFIERLLPKIFHQVIISRSHRVFFSLKYDEEFFPDPRWGQVLRLFNFYHNSYASMPQAAYYQMISDDTLFDFAKSTQNTQRNYHGEIMTTDEIREIFAFVRDKNYPLFKEFYECSARKLGGKL